MLNREIPRSEWVTFLDGFSRQHDGWLASVQVTEAGVQKKLDARDLPLKGINADLKHGDDDTVEIILGKTPGDFTHSLSRVKHIRLLQNDLGEDAGLEIESADGSKATLQFRSTASPESVDDVGRMGR